MMKRDDEFLRNYRKTPRRAFSEGLYKKLSGQRSFANWVKRGMVWGVMVMAAAYGLSSNLLGFSGPGLSTPAPGSSTSEVEHAQSPALIGERGLMPREFTPPAAEDDWLGPFDRPQSTTALAQETEPKELAVVIVPAVYR